MTPLILRFLLLALAGLFYCLDAPQALAQCTGQPAANQVCAGPTSGGGGLPRFRSLVGADVPGGGSGTLPSIAADSALGNPTGAPTNLLVAMPYPSCSAASSALTYNTTTHLFGCNTIAGGGSGTVASSTIGQIAAYTAATTVTGNANMTIGTPTASTVQIGVIGGATAGALAFANTTSGTVSVVPPAGPLASAVLTLPARTANVATTFGTLVSGHCVSIDANFNLVDAGGACTTGGGGGTVGAGTAGQLAYYGSTGTAVTGNSNFTIGSPGAGDVTVGIQSNTVGTISFANATSGTIKLQPATGALGSSVLTLPARTAGIATTTGATTTGNCAKFDASGNIIDNGAPCAVGGGNVTSGAMTTNGVTYATGASAIATTAVGTNGQLLVGQSAAPPTWNAMSGDCTMAASGAITCTKTSGSTIAVRIGSGTATLGTGAIASGSCATAVSVGATGVATTDIVSASFNGDPTGIVGYQPGAMLSILPFPTANNVNFKVCNNTGSSITPGSAIVLNWIVTR